MLLMWIAINLNNNKKETFGIGLLFVYDKNFSV